MVGFRSRAIMNNFAHLKKESPWYALFPPNGLAPIKNILVPSQGNMIGDGVQEFYDLDLDKVTPEQKDAIYTMLAAKTRCTKEEVENGIKEQGRLPLRALHVSGQETFFEVLGWVASSELLVCTIGNRHFFVPPPVATRAEARKNIQKANLACEVQRRLMHLRAERTSKWGLK